MTLRAMGRRPEQATPHVLLMSDRLKVRRIEACSIAAEMVEFQAFRDGADEQRISHPVSQEVGLP